jgi:8-oxo-dGTP diphosphatase
VSDGEIRQQFVVCFHGWTDSGRPRPDGHETVDAAWFDPADVAALPLESWSRRWIHHGLAGASEPYVE